MSHRQSSQIWLRLLALLGAWAWAACTPPLSNRRPETGEERARSVQLAVEHILHARCDLEERCAHIGPGQKFDSHSACESKMQGETAVTLNTSDCPLGVEARKLDACVSSILAQDCGNMFDALNRWNACRVGQICYQ
jgi:hypothetical protein